MRLVFVHGRSQGGRSEAEIEAEWTVGMTRGLEAVGRGPMAPDAISVPFYGDNLDEHTEQVRESVFDIVFRGSADGADVAGLDEFGAEFVQEIAERAGVTDDDIEAEMSDEVRARAPWNWEWVQATGRALDRRAPWLANVAMYNLTKDVRTYLLDTTARDEVNGIVRAHVETGPCVVVAHSLGSVVAYWLLDEMRASANVPLLVTAGSPLGIKTVKKRLPRPLGMPAGVAAWLNATDPRDPVALHAELGGDTFPAPIDNVSDVDNPHDNPHGIVGYLADPRVAARIADAMGI